MMSPPPAKAMPIAKIGRPKRVGQRERHNRVFGWICAAAAFGTVAILAGLLSAIVFQGKDYLSLDFIQTPPSKDPEKAGLGPALMGTIWVCVCCAFLSFPMGVGTAVFLEEFKPTSRLMKRVHGVVQLNITNLAGVPSIVYGIIGMTAFVNMFGLFGANALEPGFSIGNRGDWYFFQLPFGRSVLAGALTLTLVILPIVIISAQESLRAVPDSLRSAALGLGSTRWQSVSKVSLPAALPGIMTGMILSMSRALGEAAPLLIVAGVVYLRIPPGNLMDDFTVMPLQIYDWAGRPKDDFHKTAASGIVVLLTVLMVFNATAVFVRQKLQRPLQ